MNARTRRRTPLAAVGLVALLASGALSACGSSASTTATDPGSVAGSDSTTPSATTDPASPGPSDGGPSMIGSPIEAPSSAQPQVAVPVYYVLSTPQGPRLVQELHDVPQADPVAGAVEAMQHTPDDPDYRSFYQPGDLGDASWDGTSFTTVLVDRSLAAAGHLSRSEAALAVQQLVYTLNAAQGVTGKATTVIANGATTPLFGVATAHGVSPADQNDALAPINVLSPAEGTSVSGTLQAQGLANSPEANVPWKITDASGKVVKKGFATADGWMDKLYPWQAKIPLAGLSAGDYTFTASTANEADAGEGPGATSDTKTFTIS